MKLIKLLAEYLIYLVRAKGKHDIHSPFVFDLITNVLNDKTKYPDYSKVELIRTELLKNKTEISFKDHGAGSAFTKRKTIKEFVSTSVKPPKYGKLLYRLSRYFKPATIIELGTSAGISTSYMSLGNPVSKVISIEGAPEIAAIANGSFKKLNLKNINLITDTFESALPNVLSAGNSADLIFFDGDHKLESTLKYFNLCLSYKNNNSIFIFDDIRWSDEMKEAWKQIKDHPEVTLTVDIFFMGLVFFRQEQQVKQHFLIRY